MAVGAFCGTLAASASIFIGILTAFLVNDLMNKMQGKRRALYRIDQIDSRLETLRSKQTRFEDDIQELEDQWEEERREQAQDDVERFIDQRVGSYEFTIPVENLSRNRLLQELVEFLRYDDPSELDEYHEQWLDAHQDEIESALRNEVVAMYARDREDESTPLLEDFIEGFQERFDIDDLEEQTRNALEVEYESRFSRSLSGLNRLLDNPLFSENIGIDVPMAPEIQGANITASVTRSVHEQRVHFQLNQKLIETQAEISSLSEERRRLVARVSSIDTAELWRLLVYNVATIFMSVVVPVWPISSMYMVGSSQTR